MDGNGDGCIDARDPLFASLRLWRDVNRDGVGTPGELRTLADEGIRALSLAARKIEGAAALDRHGNRISLVSHFERADGRHGALVDAWLRFRPIPEPQRLALCM